MESRPVPVDRPVESGHSNRLSLRQRFYLLEVLVGLGVTAHHFFTNMWRHTLHTVFRVKSARGAVTNVGDLE